MSSLHDHRRIQNLRVHAGAQFGGQQRQQGSQALAARRHEVARGVIGQGIGLLDRSSQLVFHGCEMVTQILRQLRVSDGQRQSSGYRFCGHGRNAAAVSVSSSTPEGMMPRTSVTITAAATATELRPSDATTAVLSSAGSVKNINTMMRT